MSIQVRGKVIKLVGTCSVEDAETLHEKLLAAKSDATLDLAQCQHLHAAVLQVLLVQPRAVKRGPGDAFLQQWVMPLLQRAWDEQSGVSTST